MEARALKAPLSFFSQVPGHHRRRQISVSLARNGRRLAALALLVAAPAFGQTRDCTTECTFVSDPFPPPPAIQPDSCRLYNGTTALVTSPVVAVSGGVACSLVQMFPEGTSVSAFATALVAGVQSGSSNTIAFISSRGPSAPTNAHVAQDSSQAMSVAFRNKSVAFVNSGAGGSVTPTEPVGAAQNDILLYLADFHWPTALDDAGPVGWALLASQVDNVSGSNRFYGALYAIRRGASAPALNANDGGNSRYLEVSVSAWSGVDPNIALSSLIVSSGTPVVADPSNPDPPSITTTTDNSMVVCFGLSNAGATTVWTAPSTYALGENGAAAGGGQNTFAYKIITPAGTENPGAFSGADPGSDPNWSLCVALPPAVVVGLAPQSRIVRQALNRASTY